MEHERRLFKSREKKLKDGKQTLMLHQAQQLIFSHLNMSPDVSDYTDKKTFSSHKKRSKSFSHLTVENQSPEKFMSNSVGAVKDQTRFNVPERRFYKYKDRNFSSTSASDPRPSTRRPSLKENLKDNDVTPKKRLRINNDGDDIATTAKSFSENVENSDEYYRKELKKHRKFISEASKDFNHTSRRNTSFFNSSTDEAFVSPSSRWPTPSKDSPIKEHRLSERFTSSSSSCANWRKRKSFEDMDWSPVRRRSSLSGKAFFATEFKSINFMDSLNDEQFGMARSVLQSELDSDLPYVDTHCHFDFLFKRMSFYDTVEEYAKKTFFKFPSSFEGCIADWCQPALYSRAPHVLKHNNGKFKVWGAFGCHPHFVSDYSDAVEKSIEFHLETYPNVIAWGEMGLDYSDRFGATDHSLQKKVFIRQLKQATRRDLPLVIHCRDADPDLIEIMKTYVPHDAKIQRHCLTTEEKDVRELLSYFPNCYVGFTNLLTNRSAYRPRDAVSKIPLERIVLETDAPYFVPRCVTGKSKGNAKWSHPAMASSVAVEIAYIKNITTQDVLETVRDNVYQLYGI